MASGYEPGESPPSGRLGPMPPRMGPVGAPTGPRSPGPPSSPGPPGPPSGSGYPPPGPGSGYPSTGNPSGGYPTVGGPPTGALPPPGSPAARNPHTGTFPQAGSSGYQGYQPPVYQPGSAQPGPPTGPIPMSGQPAFSAFPGTPTGVYSAPPGPTPTGRRSRSTIVLLVLVILLVFTALGQGFLLLRMDQRLADLDARAAAASRDDDTRLDGLETRAKDLEQRAGKTLDAAAVASAVTPSVFLLDAGSSLGTAFAFGPAPAGGGTDLVTNYHVIQTVFERGGRDVALQRDNKRYPARILRTDARRDLAIVHVVEDFPRLQPATEPAQPGAPVVVIGAPLGLENTVTSGVVSAVRDSDEGGLIQFDAPINGGNSGGPVVNAQQQVAGVATAKAREAEGIGAAIPVAIVCRTFTLC